jgi:predicted esterase
MVSLAEQKRLESLIGAAMEEAHAIRTAERVLLTIDSPVSNPDDSNAGVAGGDSAGDQGASALTDLTASVPGSPHARPCGSAVPLPEIPGVELLRHVRRGGQADVFEGREIGTDRRVAVKVLRSGADASPDEVARFEREARILSSLRHPGVVAARGFGRCGGRWYCVMDFIGGERIDEFVRSRGLSEREIVELLADVGDAVHAAHQRGVIHRDLKPANILIDPTGQARVLDFGLAKLSGDASSFGTIGADLTATGQFVGTLAWASPEQVKGRHDDVDVRTDVYALGVIAFELLAGRPPYDTLGSAHRAMRAIVEEPPARLRSFDPARSRDVETIVNKCLSKEPGRRYSSASELSADLRRAARGEAIEAKRDSRLYVLAKAARAFRVPIAAGLVAMCGGVAFGAVMSGMYQDAKREAVVATQEADRLRGELERLKADLVAPANWTTTFESAKRLQTLSPEDGWDVLSAAWKEMTSDEPKQQLLKSVSVAKPAYLVRAMHLGMSDRSPAVQQWAIEYLRGIAFIDFAEEYDRYAVWYAACADKPLAETIKDGLSRVAAELPKADAKRRERLSELAGELRLEGDAALIEAVKASGVIGSMLDIFTAPASSRDEVRAAGQFLTQAGVDEGTLRERVLPMIGEDREVEGVSAAARMLGASRKPWAIEALKDRLTRLVLDAKPGAKPSIPANVFSQPLGDSGFVTLIPHLIALIETEDTSETIYGIGYFALGRLTGVKYDESHDGAWWRNWWEKNRQRFGEPVSSMNIPDLRAGAQGRAEKPKDPRAEKERRRRLASSSELTDELRSLLGEATPDRTAEIFDVAGEIAKRRDPSVIPTLIAVIVADGTYDTVYGVGHFGLGELTGVRYDESHDGAWWTNWWTSNRVRFGEPLATAEIPLLDIKIGKAASVEDSTRLAGGDEKKKYLISPARIDKAPAEGYGLLLVLPGGDGSAEFWPWVSNIARECTPEDWVTVQLVAPKWSEDQFDTVVWPTAVLPWNGAAFTTERFVADVIADLAKTLVIDHRRIFMLGWSSGGPPTYATLATFGSEIDGAMVAMSVFKKEHLPRSDDGGIDGVYGRACYILHSPDDQMIPMRFPESARDELIKAGATAELKTYAGGHGWHGDALGEIRQGLGWLKEWSEKKKVW